MFKRLLIGLLAGIVVAAAGTSVIAAFAAPQGTDVIAAEPAAESSAVGLLTDVVVDGEGLEPTAAAAAVSTDSNEALTALNSANETADLLYMYEEEKMARDVYNALYGLWGQETFLNIAASEQEHMDAVASLMVQFGIAVPDGAAGTFQDGAIQSLYDSLMAQGSISLVEALKVGAMIEEVDILDLQARLARTTNTEIQIVYDNLLNGSYNHLRSFIMVLERQTGVSYTPVVMTAETYQSILAMASGNGSETSGGRGQGGGGRGHRGGG